jgi:putative membrane protein
MKTLILCIDRDNDLGRKTGISSPVIGRDENIRAVEALALADPEESDVNCMFSAISTYDKQESNAEIATICGSTKVGTDSDTIIARQLDRVIQEVKPDGVIVIADGEEDEYILPLIQSRIKVNAVKRVVVRQSETLEGTYYLISRFMEDEKMQRKFMLPVALVLFLWGLSALLGSPAWGFATILLVLGAYLLMKVFHLQGFVARIGKEAYNGLRSGRISLFSNLLAVFILVSAIISSYNTVTTIVPDPENIVEYIIRFLDDVVWWFVLAVLISAAGRFTDVYFKEKRVLWGYIILPFSLVALGLILSASLEMLIKILYNNEPLQSLLTMPFLTRVIEGVLLAFIGTVIYHIADGMYGTETPEKN